MTDPVHLPAVQIYLSTVKQPSHKSMQTQQKICQCLYDSQLSILVSFQPFLLANNNYIRHITTGLAKCEKVSKSDSYQH